MMKKLILILNILIKLKVKITYFINAKKGQGVKEGVKLTN